MKSLVFVSSPSKDCVVPALFFIHETNACLVFWDFGIFFLSRSKQRVKGNFVFFFFPGHAARIEALMLVSPFSFDGTLSIFASQVPLRVVVERAKLRRSLTGGKKKNRRREIEEKEKNNAAGE